MQIVSPSITMVENKETNQKLTINLEDNPRTKNLENKPISKHYPQGESRLRNLDKETFEPIKKLGRSKNHKGTIQTILSHIL